MWRPISQFCSLLFAATVPLSMGMKSALGGLFRRFLFGINLLLLLPAILVTLAPYVAPTGWFWPNVFALAAPYWLLIPIIWLIVWGWRRKWKFMLVNLALLLLNIGLWPKFYQANAPLASKDKDIKIITMNVNAFIYNYERYEEILAFLKEQNPDILCLQEFYDWEGLRGGNPSSGPRLAKELDLQHWVNIPLIPGQHRFGLAFYSRYPILNAKNVTPSDSAATNGIAYADIKVYGEIMRLFNVHLQSYKFSIKQRRLFEQQGAERPHIDKNQWDARSGWSFLKVMLHTWRDQDHQVRQFEATEKHNDKNTIICADLNNVPYSNYYKRIRGDLQDSFIERGSGTGTTYPVRMLPLRIDYVFAGENFTVVKHEVLPTAGVLSDHNALATTVRFRFHN